MLPQTSGEVSCESLLRFNALQIDASGSVVALPNFMTADVTNRKLNIFLSTLLG
jgi:hypothetical protein